MGLKDTIVYFARRRTQAMYSKGDLKIAERRKHDRYNCEASIEWSYFNTGIYFDAKLLNFSRGGVYIETAHDIMPGTTIIMRLIKVFSNKIDSTDLKYPRLVSMGEVTWHTNISRKHQSYHGAGVRYPIHA